MGRRPYPVNLDAMIRREDFAITSDQSVNFEQVQSLPINELAESGLWGLSLRKPDFQRETNHWSPEQVLSLLVSFISGDLIPSVILWRSRSYIFVIDGGHRLSALKAWIEDDYGDGPISQKYFGYEVSAEQKKTAKRVRQLIESEKGIGTWKHVQSRIKDDNLGIDERANLTTIVSRGLPIQWVNGDAKKAETSFFKINTQGTPLDDIEELLLKNRRKPIAIAARAIIRAGKGHRYWSSFSPEFSRKIEDAAAALHATLFDPEFTQPVKTLDLPLGGPKGIRNALQVLIDLTFLAVRNQQGEPRDIGKTQDDSDGSLTIESLNKVLALARRMTGNDGGSLGLHPAIYYYGPTMRHSSAMFMGTASLIAQKLRNNDKTFFLKFSKIRAKLEELLIEHKELIASILQRHISRNRVEKYSVFLNGLIEALILDKTVSEPELIHLAGLEGKVISGSATNGSSRFSDDVKSETFIKAALKSALRCSICNGYIDPAKSLSYDHDIRVRDGGAGDANNCRLAHPFCNQSVKC